MYSTVDRSGRVFARASGDTVEPVCSAYAKATGSPAFRFAYWIEVVRSGTSAAASAYL
jgi:hypothetical protein